MEIDGDTFYHLIERKNYSAIELERSMAFEGENVRRKTWPLKPPRLARLSWVFSFATR